MKIPPPCGVWEICAGIIALALVVGRAEAGGLQTVASLDSGSGDIPQAGLIAAGGIVGLLGVGLKLYETTVDKGDILNFPPTFLDHQWVSVVAFAALAFSLYYFARKPLKK